MQMNLSTEHKDKTKENRDMAYKRSDIAKMLLLEMAFLKMVIQLRGVREEEIENFIFDNGSEELIREIVYKGIGLSRIEEDLRIKLLIHIEQERVQEETEAKIRVLEQQIQELKDQNNELQKEPKVYIKRSYWT
jgi:hypothetical protein